MLKSFAPLKSTPFRVPRTVPLPSILGRGSVAKNIAFLSKIHSRSPKTATALSLFFAQILPQCWRVSKQQTCGLVIPPHISLYPENHPSHDMFEGLNGSPSAKLQAPENSLAQNCNSNQRLRSNPGVTGRKTRVTGHGSRATALTLWPPFSRLSRALLRWCRPCRTPARGDRRACLRQFP